MGDGGFGCLESEGALLSTGSVGRHWFGATLSARLLNLRPRGLAARLRLRASRFVRAFAVTATFTQLGSHGGNGTGRPRGSRVVRR